MTDIEIIPNYHPIFVHFTIGLLSAAALLYLAGSIFKKENLLIAARWNLWIGTIATVGTIISGLDAYNTVSHDAASHAAMTDHRNWALSAAGAFSLLALLALWKQRGAKTISSLFVAAIILATGLLTVSGYKGGEVVYRHGTGVLRMPAIHGEDGHDNHNHEEESSEPRTKHDHDHGTHEY
ncbi:MAG: hypothetical protein CVV45_08255 [Spirochaetae bacterium HGW-Spirochaetae-10]|nr:MAG: hypothetical protein CVV45_08255 [Spirochaetae bacterium HGW-Spirochaetae-10]